MRDRSGIEEWRHEIEVVEFAFEAKMRTVLPAIPDRAESQYHLAQLRSGRFEFHREAPLIVRSHLRPKSEDEASCGGFLKVPCRVGSDHGTTGKGNGDRCDELDLRSCRCSNTERQERIVLSFRCPYAVVSDRLGAAGEFRNTFQIVIAKGNVKQHGAFVGL